jgi:hypothetical protein
VKDGMCFQKVLKVRTVAAGRAQMEDGREVLVGAINSVRSGEYLRVYANIAIDKVAKKEKHI